MLVWLFLFLLLFSGCHSRDGAAYAPAESEPVIEEEDPAIAQERALRERAFCIANAMDDRQLAAQVMIAGIEGRSRLSANMRALFGEIPTGGIMLFRFNLGTDDEVQGLIAESRDIIGTGNAIAGLAAIAPFVAVDHEGGTVDRFRRSSTNLPSAAFFRELAENEGWQAAIEQISADSFRAGEALAGFGVNLNFAPVAEHLNDANRDFLARRSYGPDPEFTAQASAAFVRGMEAAGILCAVKHFPGNAGADPHYHPSVLAGDFDAIAELASPFAALIRDGHARAIMVSHSSVPAWDSENIASLSSNVMCGWLRGELGFDGFIISDDFIMAAATGGQSNLRPEAAAVLSIAAGSDMVLVWPRDLRRTHEAILTALDEERLSRERLREAAGRVLFEKLRMGLAREQEAMNNEQETMNSEGMQDG